MNSRVVRMLISGLVLASCEPSGNETDTADSRTGNWTLSCATDAECGDEFGCTCGTCTRPCVDSSCPSGLECRTPDFEACEESDGVEPVCLAPCATPADCPVEADYACSGGVCALPVPTCRLEPTATATDWQSETAGAIECECSEAEPRCGGVHQGRIVDVSGLQVSAEFRLIEPEESLNNEVTWFASVGVGSSVECWTLVDRTTRATGVYSLADSSVTITVPVLGIDGEFDALPEGSTVYVTFSTGSSAAPGTPTYFAPQALGLTKVCD